MFPQYSFVQFEACPKIMRIMMRFKYKSIKFNFCQIRLNEKVCIMCHFSLDWTSNLKKNQTNIIIFIVWTMWCIFFCLYKTCQIPPFFLRFVQELHILISQTWENKYQSFFLRGLDGGLNTHHEDHDNIRTPWIIIPRAISVDYDNFDYNTM